MARARYMQLALAVALMSCGGGEEQQRVADTAKTPDAKASAAVSDSSSPVVCLHTDSLKATNDTLRYSSLVVHEETGDLLGTDVRLARSGVAWSGTVALAQGELGQAKPLETINLDTRSGSLTLAWQGPGARATFEGLLTCASLIGDFRWYPGAEPERDTLSRQR